jgi:CubicO group peptidase (beta-lactamase class C family)
MPDFLRRLWISLLPVAALSMGQGAAAQDASVPPENSVSAAQNSATASLAPSGTGVLPRPDMTGPSAAILLTFDRTGAQQTRVVRGYADRWAQRRLTADDPVRVASISKLIVALGVMRLVDARRLDLDADVSRYLGWTLRHPAYPNRPITLAMLLGHRSGLADGVNYVLPLDADLQTVLADPKAWNATRRPGGAFEYANINYPVIAAVMEGATQQRFDQLMQRLVFQPLRIDACFNWSGCSDATVARAVTLLRPNGDLARDAPMTAVPTCAVTPASDGSCDLSRYRLAHNGAAFSPQGGVRISARGLAAIGQMLLRDGEGLLTQRSFRRLTTFQRVTPLPGTAVGEGGEGQFHCRYSLGMQQLATPVAGCRDDPFGDGVARIGHSGEAYSLRSGLYVDPESRTGVVWFVTELPETGAPLASRSGFTAAEEALFTEAHMMAPAAAPTTPATPAR